MIGRYSRPEMAKIWNEENKVSKWLQIELAVCQVRADKGEIPEGSLRKIREKARFDLERIREIERVTKHDVVAFITNVGEHIGEESRHFHLGMTSSDVLDTGLALQLVEASDLLINDLEALAAVLKRRAHEFKHTPMMGRTHGVHSEPITFGLKLANWFSETLRNIERMKRAREIVRYGKISGAVGTFANIEPWVEEEVCRSLGLNHEPVSSQIVQRDRHAEFMTTLAVIGGSLDRFAVEVRHLQRTEVLEAEEFFSKGQKGSSAMPHKRNPVTSEQMSGLARILRANAAAALENMPLWHERDISHSSVERIILPDSTILLDYMLNRFTALVDNLVVYQENMRRNMELTGGLIYSERIFLELEKRGVPREEAYTMIQRNAMRARDEGLPFPDLIKSDPDVSKHLGPEILDACFELEYHLKHVDRIFERVFGKGE